MSGRNPRRIETAPSAARANEEQRAARALADALFIRQQYLLDQTRQHLVAAQRRAQLLVGSAEGTPGSFADMLTALLDASDAINVAQLDLNDAIRLEDSQR